MSHAQFIENFISTLMRLDEQLQQLLTLLVQEQDELSRPRPQHIEEIAARKLQLTEAIEQTEEQRHTLCSQLNIAPDKQALQAWLQDKPDRLKNTIARLWQQIAQRGQQCATQNQLNGAIVNHHERHARDALAILRGATGNHDAYSDKGTHHSTKESQVIARA